MSMNKIHQGNLPNRVDMNHRFRKNHRTVSQENQARIQSHEVPDIPILFTATKQE